jgi:formylglycine-generating enzyme required for sulfatase activity
LVAALTLPSRFDEAFETIASHGDAGKARPVKEATSSVHGAISGAVPKYDGKASASNWWGDAGAPFKDEAQRNYERLGQSSGGPSLMGMLRQQLADSGASGDESPDVPLQAGGPDKRPGFSGMLTALAMNPFGDVQSMAAALPASASFHSSVIPLRGSAVSVDDGVRGGSGVPVLRASNSYSAASISVGGDHLAFNAASTNASASAVSAVSSASLSSPPQVAQDTFTPVSFRASSTSVSLPAIAVISPTPYTPPAPQIPARASRGVSPMVASSAPSSPSSPSPSLSLDTSTTATSLSLSSPSSSANVGYQFVPVGNPGNANDTATGNKYGGVNYTYDIGQYDVTLNQYATFLNDVAALDSYGLYNVKMASDVHIAGISRTGANGSYSYSVIGDGSRPVTYVSWFDAARFANWMNNGQPIGMGEVSGSTEDGAYTLHGANAGIVTKNANAQVWIPTESEWYKAAYYDPTLNGGTGGYWLDAAKSNDPPGNTVGNQPNQGNYFNGTYSVGGTGNLLTDVGAFTMSMSPYGTFDQMGLVNQWNDALVSSTDRGLRGGAWDSFGYTYLLSTDRGQSDPTFESADIGFRLATVPESSTWTSLLGGAAVLLVWRRRRSAA